MLLRTAHNVTHTRAHKPRDLTITLEFWGFWATVQDTLRTQEMTFPTFCRTHKRKSERDSHREREAESTGREWEFLSGNRAFTVSYYTEKRRKRRRVNGG